jgi:pyridoxal phosphate enzyme (YggS family)
VVELREAYHRITDNIAAAAKRSGRSPEDITLVAVTKFVPVERIIEAVELGVTQIGENRAQEFNDKYEKLRNLKIFFNFIGHLQLNKVKYIVSKASLIQSVDRLDLADKIQSLAKTLNIVQDVLIQVNIGDEPQKSGVAENELFSLLEKVSILTNVHIKGLMCVPPNLTAEETRPYFIRTKALFDQIKLKGIPNVDMQYLSMGMSGDYEAAIEEGANMVRIGSALFGQRIY